MAAELFAAAGERGTMYDLLIKEARIVDGTGSPYFYGDLGVIGDHIAQVGRLSGKARRVVVAEGQVLAPGFIDIHSHSDSAYLVNPLGESKVRQGVTTEVMGQCGFSLAPVSGLAVDELQGELREYGLELGWRSMGEYLVRLSEVRPAVNLATVVGHGTIRGAVMGYEPRPPTGEELERMRRLLREALAEGAFGLSTGLIYPPGAFAQTEEIVALARELAPFGGIYFTHMRNEGDRLLEAVGEAVRIGEEAGVPVEIAHLKVGGEKNWGKAGEALSAIWEARSRGVDVTCDQYPYTATSTGLSSILPRWAHAGGPERLLARLGDRALLIEFEEVISPEVNRRVRNLMHGIEQERIAGVEELVPAYRSLLVYYNPRMIDFADLATRIQEIEGKIGKLKLPMPRGVRLPVCYGGEMGPDLPYVAEHNRLTEEEVIAIHAQATYLVYMIGFLPGFPYLGGMSPKIATPRLSEPRTRIPAGSVGIAGDQTGIYPLESPGGWRIIGRTPIELFTPQNEPPVLLAMGDFVNFFPISAKEFQGIRTQVERGEYRVEVVNKDGD